MKSSNRRDGMIERLAQGCLAAAALAMAGVLGVSGSSSLSAPVSAATADEPQGNGAAKKNEWEKPNWDILFPDWSEDSKPAFVIALTGETLGHLRPCGCSEGMSGGLARRDGLLKFLRDALKLNLLPIDLGDVIGNTSKIEEMRHDAVRKGLAQLGYKVVGLGRQDLRIPLLTLLQKLANETEVKTVVGNVKALEKGMQDQLTVYTKPFEVVEFAGKRIVVGSLWDQSELDKHTEIAIEPVDAASAALLNAADAVKPDVKVLLAYMSKEKGIEFAKRNPGWDVILTRAKGDAAQTQNDQHREGNTLIVQVGRKGTWMGFVGYWPEAKYKFRYAAIEVNPRFDETASVEQIYNDFVSEIAESDALTTWSKNSHAKLDEYVGAEACGKCHTKAHKKWSEQVDSTHGKGHGHAFAFESLKKDKAKYQTSNPECLKCHTTGLDYHTGFVTAEKTPKLLGNQCENCHGPGKRHAENKDDLGFRRAMKLSQFEVEYSVCRKCHDLDNSPNFDFQKHWSKIAHPWKD